MKRLFSVVLVFVCVSLFSGCQHARQSRTDMAMQEANRLSPPRKALSSYSSYVLEGMELSDVVKTDKKKVKVAGDLETKLKNKIDPLIGGWNTKQSGGNGTLVIKPILQSLRVVSGGARFWVGAMAGDSSIDMDLLLIDKKTGEQIARPRIIRTSGGYGGAWSVGATDRNLLNNVADIAYQYLLQNNK